MSTNATGPYGAEFSGELGPLPNPYTTVTRVDSGGFFRPAALFTEDQLRTYAAEQVAAERERWRARVEEAFKDGFYAPRTYNDTVLNTASEAWEEAKAGLLKA